MDTALRKKIGREEFDYPALMDALSYYANPRDRATVLLRRGDIIRVKKGLYVFGDELRLRPYSRELLANLIYGPSFISLDSALVYHGLIPERVEAITSVTPKRPKRISTPVGLFIYRQTPKISFHLGMDRIEERDIAFLIAVPERALADKIRSERGHPLRTQVDMSRYLFEDLRVERDGYLKLDPELLDELATAMRSQKVGVCARLLRNLRGES